MIYTHPLKDYLHSFQLMTSSEIEGFLQLGILKTVQKNELFIKEGSVCKKIAFLLSGNTRSFYRTKEGKEMTYCFNFQNSFITAYSSLINQKPTIENIQALSNIQILEYSKSDIDSLALENKNWMRFQKEIAEQQYIELENRVFQLQSINAKQKYANLLQQYPLALQSIPLQYLASYLGISERHLSRIKNKS